jgi:hypothetical protein
MGWKFIFHPIYFNMLKVGQKVTLVDKDFLKLDHRKTYSITSIKDSRGEFLVSLEGVEGYYYTWRFKVVKKTLNLPEWF